MVKKRFTEKEEHQLLERDTRNILLGALLSMMSTITALYIVNVYLIPKTASAIVNEYVKTTTIKQSTSKPSSKRLSLSTNTLTWEPLLPEQIYQIRQTVQTHARGNYGEGN